MAPDSAPIRSSPDRQPWYLRPTLLFAAGLLLCLAALGAGLTGGYILDDQDNLEGIERYADGTISGWQATTSNQSGPLRRPLSMASFVATAAIAGHTPEAHKAVGILLHGACAILLLLLYRRMLACDPRRATNAGAIAAVLALWWAVLPLQVSTVLYVVQRMTQLSALFSIAALILYMDGRLRIESSAPGWRLRLFLGFPLLTLLSILSKENGALTPLLAAVIELTLFAPAAGRGGARPAAVRWFHALFLLLPALLAMVAMLLRPQRFFGGYAIRDFSLWQRVLTEPRVLWDYVGAILIPNGPSLGLLHDNFPRSTGLLEPATTLVAIVAWLALIAVAWRARRRMPLFAAGVGLFLAGHAMESSVLPLELYFEHRNYLPAMGVLLAVAELGLQAFERLPRPTRDFDWFLRAAPLLVFLGYLLPMHARAVVWGDARSLLAQALAANPSSPRLRTMLAVQSMGDHDLAGALAHLEAAAANDPRRDLAVAALWRGLAYCETQTPAPAGLLDPARVLVGGVITPVGARAFELLSNRVEHGSCPGIDADGLSAIGATWVDTAIQAPTELPAWRTRYFVARLLASQQRWKEAIARAESAWSYSGSNSGVGILVLQLYATSGDWAGARDALDRLEASAASGDRALLAALPGLRQQVQERSAAATPAPPPG